MLRYLIGILITLFVITFLRAVIGLIGKAVAELFEPASSPDAAKSAKTPAGGQLVQDPVCGIYVSTATRLRKDKGGKTYYFCSEACRDKFDAA
jgi:Cu+-exporting ATPase